MHKKIMGLGIILFSFIVLATMAHALPVTIEDVKIDNDVIYPIAAGQTNILELERGQDFDLKVRVHANPGTTLDHVQISAEIKGSEFKDVISDSTESFKLKESVSTIKRLKLHVPSRLEQDNFRLRVRVEDRDGATTQTDYEIQISSKRNQITIKDIILSPENEIKAGRTLVTSLRLKNTGQRDQKGVKIKISIPELGVSATDYVSELEKESDKNDQATSNNIFLRIPDDADTGVYTLRAEVYFRDGDEVTAKETKVRVIGADKTPTGSTAASTKTDEKTVLFVPSDSQSVVAGSSEVFYPITITNSGSASKSYTISVDGASWGTVRIAPSNVAVVNPADSKTVNIYVAAKSDASAGEQMFLVTIKNDDKILKQIPLKAVISKQASAEPTKLESVLKVLAIVLLAILVTIGLIFIFSSMMRRDDERGNGKAETEPYY